MIRRSNNIGGHTTHTQNTPNKQQLRPKHKNLYSSSSSVLTVGHSYV